MFDFDFDVLAGGDDAEPEAQTVKDECSKEVQTAKDELSEDRFVGSWAYLGQQGITIYTVRKTVSGHFLFEGPNAQGDIVSGVLRRQGLYLQAELVSQSGETVGWIRLTLLEEEYAVISSFKAAGKTEWGRDIKANRYFPAAPKASKEEPKVVWEDEVFTVHSGFIRAGGDLGDEEMTIAAAKERCKAIQDCRGFSFNGELPDADAVVKVYFKDRWDLARGGGWTSYRYEAAALKLSDLPGEHVDEQIITEVARSRFNSVHVFKSPLATFPEWKKNLKVHQIVILWHSDGIGMQIEYFVGGVHFQRKPYPWVHRQGAELVDEVVPAQPAGGFGGQKVSQVLKKWIEAGRSLNNEAPASKDCIIFAMEVVEAVGAMTSHLLAHFQTTLGMQNNGWDEVWRP